MQFYLFVNMMVLVSRFERIVLNTLKCNMEHMIWTILWTKLYGPYVGTIQWVGRFLECIYLFILNHFLGKSTTLIPKM